MRGPGNEVRLELESRAHDVNDALFMGFPKCIGEAPLVGMKFNIRVWVLFTLK